MWGCHPYVIQGGQVGARLIADNGDEICLYDLGPGESFGETALLDGGPRIADFVALTPCTLRLLEREDFLTFLTDNPSSLKSLLLLLGRRVRRLTQGLQSAGLLNTCDLK